MATRTKRPTLHSVTEDSAPVTADEGGASTPPSTVTAAAATGDERQLLIALRSRISKTVDSAKCPPRDLAALTRRLQEIGERIKALDIEAEERGEGNEPAADEAFDPKAV